MRTSLEAALDVPDERVESNPRHVVEKKEDFEFAIDTINAVTRDLDAVDKQIFEMRFYGKASFKDIGSAVRRTNEAARLRYFRIYKRIQSAGRRRAEIQLGTTF